jgi:hypothetical protein
MEETTEQYITRLLANVGDRNPLKVQAATAEKLERLVRRLPRAKLRQRPGPDKWSIAEIVAHLADAEIVISWRIRAILGAPGTPIQAYDQNVWAREGQYTTKDPRASIAQFRAFRQANLAFFKSLRPEQWKRHGVHEERGEESIERFLHLTAGHDLNHLAQIERIATRKRPSKTRPKRRRN